MSSHAPWRVLKRKTAYESPWVSLRQDTVQLPDGTVIEDHHVVDYPGPAVGVVPLAADGRVLLIDHYRFITQTRGWEIPAGRVEHNETPEQAGLRELLEETAYAATSLQKLGRDCPSIGTSNLVHHYFVARGLTYTGGKVDSNEALDRRWFTVAEIRQLIGQNAILDGMTLTALLWAFYAGVLK